MSKIIFEKYLPPVKPKLVPKLKFIEIWQIWYFEYPDLDSDFKDYFDEIFTACSAQIGPKI